MERIVTAVKNLLDVFGRLVDSTIGANGTGRALLVTYGPISVDESFRRS